MLEGTKFFFSYVAIFVSVKSSMDQMERMGKSSSGANEYHLAKKLMIIVFTDFLCWVRAVFRPRASASYSRCLNLESSCLVVADTRPLCKIILPVSNANISCIYHVKPHGLDADKRSAMSFVRVFLRH